MGRRSLALACAAALLIASGCVGGEVSRQTVAAPPADEQITIAIAGMVTPQEGLAYYEDLSRYVGAKVGRKVRLLHKAEYAEANRMVKDRKVDVAFVCAGPYVSGHDDFGMELVAAPVVNGEPLYYSYVIVGKDSPISDLEGLRGKKFAFADPQSNTGKLVPTFLLAKMGEKPETFFGSFFYTYSHDVSIKAVATGDADGAAVDSLIWEYSNGKDPVHTSRTRIVLKSDPFATPPVVVHPDMDPKLKAAIRAAFVGAADDPEAKPILEKMGIDGFVVVEDSDYDSIRDMNAWIEKNR